MIDGKLKFKLIHEPSIGFIPSLAPHMLRGTDAKDWIPEGADHIVCMNWREGMS